MKKIFILFFAFSAVLLGQESGEEDTGIWYMYFGTNKIAERWSVHTEAQFRYYETSSNFNQLLLRTGLNYHINSNAIASIGYGYVRTDPDFSDFRIFDDILLDDIRINEQRIFEQFILKNKVGEFLFEHRYRLEQRILSFADRGDPQFDRRTDHRIRYRLQVTLPLTDIFFINVYDEIFINLQDNLFGQNRLYGALGIHITDNSSLQLGYLRNQFSANVFNRYQIGIFFNPDLRKKSK